MQQQRQLRLGDILDDYCPRERRVTNHAVVALIGVDVKQTRCTTCDTEHEFKHAKVPRQRRKAETPAALYAQVAANAPKRVVHETPAHPVSDQMNEEFVASSELDVDGQPESEHLHSDNGDGPPHDHTVSREMEPDDADAPDDEREGEEDGPVHRPLIRASLPRPEGQQPPARPIPEFTIRQPGGRPGRFRPRHPRGGGQQGQQFGSNRGNGNMAGGPPRGMRSGGGPRPQGGSMPSRIGRRHGQGGRKRSK